MKRNPILSGIVILMLMTIACSISRTDATETPTPGIPEVVLTSAAQTVESRLTQTAAKTTPSATPSPAVTQPLLPTPFVLQVTKPSVPTVTQTSVARCDWAEFVADVTIPDNAQVYPSASFTKTWRLKNIGTCTWTTNYTLVYDSGIQMGTTTSVNLSKVVYPGETIDVSVTLTAPSTAGRAVGNWKLRGSRDQYFGVGSNAVSWIYVQIQVLGYTPTATETSAYPTVTMTPTSTITLTLAAAGTVDAPE